MFAAFSELGSVELTLYTDALIVRGSVRTRQHRVTDILNLAETPFLVLEQVSVTDLDGHGNPFDTDIAQVNLDAVLFAVVDSPVRSSPELHSPKMQREAIVSIPPFRVTGTLHLLAGSANLREALTDLTGRFLPVTDASFEAPTLEFAPQEAMMLAVNHQRAQILARYAQPGDRPVEGGVRSEWIGEAPVTQGTGAFEPSSDTSGGSRTPASDPWAGATWSDGKPDGG